MYRWYIYYGSWWALQFLWPPDWFSLGIHIDPRYRVRGDKKTFGPYIDLHLGFWILSLGNHPIYSSEFDQSVSVSRGGVSYYDVHR